MPCHQEKWIEPEHICVGETIPTLAEDTEGPQWDWITPSIAQGLFSWSPHSAGRHLPSVISTKMGNPKFKKVRDMSFALRLVIVEKIWPYHDLFQIPNQYNMNNFLQLKK